MEGVCISVIGVLLNVYNACDNVSLYMYTVYVMGVPLWYSAWEGVLLYMCTVYDGVLLYTCTVYGMEVPLSVYMLTG